MNVTLEKPVKEQLAEILKTQFHFEGHIDANHMEIPLTAPYFGMNSVKLYHFLMCVEEAFRIYFEADEVLKGGMYTLAEFQRAIEKKLWNE